MNGKLLRTGLAGLLLLSLAPHSTPPAEAETGGLVWTTTTLSQARSRLAATTVGTKAIFAGGQTTGDDAPSNKVDIYDSATGAWSAATLPGGARAYLAATTVGTKALFAGGRSRAGSLGPSKAVDIYDGQAGTWSAAELSRPRLVLAATTVGNKALFAGGLEDVVPVNVVDIYDGQTSTWTIATLSQARSSLAATTVGNKALFAGGWNQSSSNRVDIYDGQTGTWTIATLSQARWGLAATTVGNKALFAGGYIDNASPISNVVDIYDSTTGTWTLATLSQARYNLAATAAGGKAFFAGGSPNSDVVDIYDVTTGWSTATLSQARAELAATTVGGTALFAGGVNSSGVSSVVDMARDIGASAPVAFSTSVQGVAVSVTVQPGAVDFGPVPIGGAKVSAQITATNAGAGPVELLLQGTNATAAVAGEGNWTLGPSPGANIYAVGSGNASTGPFTPLSTNASSLATNVAANGTKSFFLELKLPTSTTGNGVRNGTVTVIAVAS